MTKRERERERENSCKRENETRTETWKGKTTEARPTPPHPELHSQLFSNEKNKQSLKKKPQGCYRGEQKKSRREFRDWEKERKKSKEKIIITYITIYRLLKKLYSNSNSNSNI